MIDEAMIEDLLPFILMFIAMVAMGGVLAYKAIKQAFTPKTEYEKMEEARRTEETSSGYGQYFNG